MSIRDLTHWWGDDEPGSRAMAHPFASLHREMDRLFDDFFKAGPARGMWPPTRGGDQLVPSVDVTETETEVQVTADLPGLEQKDIEIELRDGALTIKGERRMEEEEKKKEFHRLERAYGRYQRVVQLPCEVQEDKAAASFSRGVLTVTLPKAVSAQKKARKIEVKAS